MDSNQKRYFSAMCQTGSITKASELLFISRQGLSKSIRKLEDEVGAPLFVRKKEGVVLTEAGELLSICIRDQDELWDSCLQKIRSLERGKREIVRLGMQGLYYDYPEIQMLYDFETDHPDVHILISDRDFFSCWQGILNNELDLAITMRPPNEFDIPNQELSKSELSILVSPENRLAANANVDFQKDLVGETVFNTSAYETEAFSSAYEKFGIRYEQITADRNTLCALVAIDNGMYILQTNLVDKFSLGSILVKPVINAPFDANPYIVYQKKLTPNAEAFRLHVLARYSTG